MKKLILTMNFCLSIILAFAQDSFHPEKYENVTNNNSTELYFIRTTGFTASAIPFKTFINDKLVCRINNNRYSKHVLEPGNYYYAAQYFGKNKKPEVCSADVNLNPGDKKYVLLFQKYGFWKNKLYAAEIPESVALHIMKKLPEDRR